MILYASLRDVAFVKLDHCKKVKPTKININSLRINQTFPSFYKTPQYAAKNSLAKIMN